MTCLRMVMISIAAALLPSAPVSARQERATPELHDIMLDGRALHLEVRRGRADAPIVVLEAGATLDSREWMPVISRLLPRTDSTIITYDRAGMGRSQPLGKTYDIRNEVARLRRALRRLGLSRDLVLAGHSYGGFLIQLYARRYPKDVAALVYVDPNTVTGLDGISGAERFRTSILAAVRGGTNRFNDVPLAEAYVRTMTTMMKYPAPCGIPVTVLTQGAQDRVTNDPALIRWRDGHLSLAERTNAKLIYAAKSGHMIPDDEPELVATAIAETLRAVAETPTRKPIPCPNRQRSADRDGR
ncbi:MAG: alpha/beta fold hydrolase [Sphingobium sp.]